MRALRETTKRLNYRSLLGVAVLSILGLLFAAGLKSYSDLDAARAHEVDLHRQIAAARARIRVIDERIERIESDPVMLERLAREELGMVRQGDVIIVLPEEEPQDAGVPERSGS